jgi:hypothetical protein
MNNRSHHKILAFLILIVVCLFIAKPTFAQGKRGTSTPTQTVTRTPTRTSSPTRTVTFTPTSIPTLDEVVNPSDIAALPAGTNVLLNFNNFSNPIDGQPIPLSFAGCIWNSLDEGSAWAGITTWNFYIANGILQGTITFPRPVIINSVRVGSGSTNIFTVASNGNPDVNLTTSSNNPQTLVTGWVNPVTSLTLRSSTTDNVFDDLRMTMSGGAQTPTATFAASNTSTPTITNTPTPTITNTPTPTPSLINSPTLPGGNTPTNTPTPTATIAPSATPPSGGTGMIADYTILPQFSEIPQINIQNASALKTLFMHQSTGGYIDDSGLNCLAGLRPWNSYPTECFTYADHLPNGWPLYPRPNWSWDFWPSPMADAIAKTNQFVSLMTPATVNNYDVLGMKYCYVDGWNQSDNVGWTNPTNPTRPAGLYINTMLDLENQYPGKTFIWATSPLWNDPGSACDPGNPFNSCAQIAAFNQQVRIYAKDPRHPKPLYDIADIESHDANGNPCTAAGYEGLCTQWYDSGGGHPNIAGAIRLAKGFWWLMARISGWNGSSTITLTPTATGLPTSTNNSTATRTPTATTPTPTPTNAPSATPTATPNEVMNPADLSTLPAGTNVLINFDNFINPSDGQTIPVGYAGINWNTLAEGSPWAGITTWNIFITNGGTQGTITFPRPVIVKSIRVSSMGSNQYTLTSTGNTNVTLTTSGSNAQTLVTGWVNPVTSLTLRSSTADQVFDDLRLTTSGSTASPTPTITGGL